MPLIFGNGFSWKKAKSALRGWLCSPPEGTALIKDQVTPMLLRKYAVSIEMLFNGDHRGLHHGARQLAVLPRFTRNLPLLVPHTI